MEPLLRNFRPIKPLGALLLIGRTTIFKGDLVPGDNMIDFEAEGVDVGISLSGEIWCPDEEIHNGDHRNMSFHLSRVFLLEHASPVSPHPVRPTRPIGTVLTCYDPPAEEMAS